MKKTKPLTYIFLTIISLISVFPFFWIVSGMTNNSYDISIGKLTFGTYFTRNITKLINEFKIGTILLNSLKISVLTTIATMIICSLAAYGFTIYRSKSRDRLFGVIMLSMMIPFAALMIPLFQLVSWLKIIDTHFALIITSASSVFIIFFFRQNFLSYPLEIIEAARIDAANELKIFTSIFVPSVKSSYFAAAIYAFMTSWNSYMWPLIVIQSDIKKPTTLLISNLSSAYVPDYGLIMTAIVISTLPVIIIFFLFQKQFVQGMIGSVKG